jgi:hypothetical protein
MTMLVGFKTTTASASFTRPADTTAYADTDLVANNTTAGSVAAMQFTGFIDRNQRSGRIVGARIHKSGTTVANASFRLWLLSSEPGVANGDNGTITLATCTTVLGSIPVAATAFKAGTAGSVGHGAPDIGTAVRFNLAGTQDSVILYGYLEAEAAYSPASAEVFTVTIFAEVD